MSLETLHARSTNPLRVLHTDEFEQLRQTMSGWRVEPRLEPHRRVIEEFLAKVGDEDHWAHARMRAAGRADWR